MAKFSRRISQIHGLIIMLIGTGLAIYINSVPVTGAGMYGFMEDNIWAVVGLSQAYLLMAIIGLALRIGSRDSHSNIWHWIGALAHTPPLLAVVMYFNSMIDMNLYGPVLASIVLHSTWICIEVAFAVKTSSTEHEHAVKAF